MRVIPLCPITTTDAYGVAMQCIGDIRSYDFDNNTFTLRDTGWQNYEVHLKGVDSHALYHTARPRECGQCCPAQTVYTAETCSNGNPSTFRPSRVLCVRPRH